MLDYINKVQNPLLFEEAEDDAPWYEHVSGGYIEHDPVCGDNYHKYNNLEDED